ncbi:hypothetical protein P8452_53455 [Trifolium repens]|nr:hypothetical protein P8452_53455 [Trifolium repens]
MPVIVTMIPPSNFFLFSGGRWEAQVIKESMRFFVIAPLIPRETSNEVEIGGYVLSKGTWVWFSFIAVAQDPKNFPEPEKFKPERFDPNCDEMKKGILMLSYHLELVLGLALASSMVSKLEPSKELIRGPDKNHFRLML